MSEDRYSRHRLIAGWDQERLREARVMVAGAGAIGNEVIKLLALVGVGRLLIVDFDAVEVSNLTRSVLFRETDVGSSKAVVAAERARQIHPDITVRAIHGDLEYDVGLGVYRAMDLVIGCLDSLQARLALNRACLRVGTPWLNGAIEVSVAEVSLFASEQGACFECGMSPEMWARRNERFSCTGLQRDSRETPMPTTAVVASLAAAYLVEEALALLHAKNPQEKRGLRSGEKITASLRPYDTTVYTLPRNPECQAHERFQPIEVIDAQAELMTARDLLERSGCPGVEIELGFDLITKMECAACGESQTIFQPLERSSDSLLVCAACGGNTRYAETINRLDSEHPLSCVPLGSIGLPDRSIVCVNDGGDRRYYQLGGPYAFD